MSYKKIGTFLFALKFDILNPIKKILSDRFKKWSFTFGGIFPKNDYFSNFSKSGLKSNEFFKRKQAEKYFSKFMRKKAGEKFRIKSKEFLMRKQAEKNNL
jgi:hypothetical protein